MLSSSLLSFDASPIVSSSSARGGIIGGHQQQRVVVEETSSLSASHDGYLDDDETIIDSAMDFHLLRQQYQQHVGGGGGGDGKISYGTNFRTPAAPLVVNASTAVETTTTTTNISADSATAAAGGGSVLSTVQALLTSVDAQSNRMQKTYVESESKRASLQEELITVRSQLRIMTERTATAEALCQQLTVDAATSHETIATLRNQVTELEQQCASLKGRHGGSLELLKTFNIDFDTQRLEWKQSLDAAENEVKKLRAVASELEGKAAVSDAHKAKVWALERQLRTKESDLQENAARVRVLECKLQLVEVDLRTSKEENDALSTRITVAERQTRVSEHALLAEQFRSKHLESSLRAANNSSNKMPGSDDNEMENVRLLGELEKLSMQVVTLQNELHAAKKHSEGGSNVAVKIAADHQYQHAAVPAKAETNTSLIINEHRLLEAELNRLTLERRLAQAEEGHQNVKGASLALSTQVETLSLRLSQALQKQHDAEEIANACRKEMTVALAREMEAVYTRTVTEEQMRYHDGAVESLLFALAHAESLSLNATSEVDRFRKDAHGATVECDRLTQLLAASASTISNQSHQLSSIQREKRDAQRNVVDALERTHRCEIELAAVTAFLSCSQDELMSVHQRLMMEQQFTVMAQNNLTSASSRLQTLVGDHHHEASLDDILKYLQGSAALLKEVASTCDDIGRNPPVFYGSLALSATSSLQQQNNGASMMMASALLMSSSSSHSGAQNFGRQSLMEQQQQHQSKYQPPQSRSSGAALNNSNNNNNGFASNAFHNTLGAVSMMPGLRETILAEAAFRNHIIAEETSSWHHIAMSSVSFLGRCADYKDHIAAMTIQLQVASEHAANLFRAVKVFSLRQVRKVRVGAQYRELEQLNQKIWQRAQDIQTVLWDIINDPQMTLAKRSEIRERLELSTTHAATIPQTSSLTSLTTTNATTTLGNDVYGGTGSVGELVAHLKLENDRLLEESDRIALQAASAESRNTELRRKLADVERRAQDQAWLEASPFWRGTRASPQERSLIVDDDHRNEGGDAATAGDPQLTSALSTLHGLVASLTSTAQRSDSLLELYARFCRRTISFAESRVVALHYTGTRNVFDVCVASAFLATTLQYRNTTAAGGINTVAAGGGGNSAVFPPPGQQQQETSLLMNNSLDFSHNNTLPFSLASGARSSSSSTASASGGGTMAATSTPKLTPTRGGKHSSDVLGEAHHHYHPTHVVTGLELLKVALRNSQESENIVSAPDRPEMLHEYSQTVAEEFPELMDTEPSPTSHFPTSPLLSIKHPSSGHYSFSQIPHHQSPGSEGGRSRLQPLRGGVSHTDSSPATNADPSIVRLLHNEESTRSLIREQHAGLLAGLLHRVHEQVLWYTQLELQRVTAELSQSHAMHDGATQVDHKQQLMSYARAVDECNERLVSFMKAKDSSDQECARLRGELRRAQEDSIVAKRAALQNEEAAGELRLQLSDSEERVRLLVRDRDQLSQRLRGYAEQNLLLTEQQRLFLKSGLGSVSHRHRDDVQEQGSQTEESHLYRSTFVASSASTLLWSRGTPLHAGGGQLLATTAEESASSRQGINYDYSAPEAAQQAHAGGIAIEAASMFSPYVKDIWGSAAQPVRLAQTSTPPQVVSHRQHLHPPASSPFRRDPSVASSLKAAFVATSPLKDAHARGYRSLEEWDRVLEAKAESFLHKEVEWSVKERQLLVLERELDARIKQTSRESSLLRFQLQETKSKLTLVVRVSRMLLQSRKMRQRHLMSVETAAMTIEDPLRLVASPLGGSSAATTQSTSKTKNSSSSGAPPVFSSVGTQVEKDEFQEEATGVAASSQRSGGGGSSWWSSTKDAVLSRTGTR